MKNLSRRVLTHLFAGTGLLAISSANATTPPEMQPDITSCPTAFFAVSIHKDAKQCQRFDTDMPASLVYFVADTPQSLVAYYLELMPDLSLKGTFNQRVLLVNTQQDVRVVVSPDGDGAQVDILVLNTADDALTSLTSTGE